MTNKANDDDRVVADMSGIERRPMLLPRGRDRADNGPPRREDPRPPWDESGKWSKTERRSAIWAALNASLLIYAAFAVGLGLVVLLMVLMWR